MKKQKEEAERYAQVQQQRKELQQRSYLLKLYAIEREVHALQTKMAEASEEAELADNRHKSSEEAVQAGEKERARLGKYAASAHRRPCSERRARPAYHCSASAPVCMSSQLGPVATLPQPSPLPRPLLTASFIHVLSAPPSRPPRLRMVLKLERELVKLQRDLEGQNPAAIRTREEIAHTTKRKAMSEKSLEKIVTTHKKACARRPTWISGRVVIGSPAHAPTDRHPDLERMPSLPAKMGPESALSSTTVHAPPRDRRRSTWRSSSASTRRSPRR